MRKINNAVPVKSPCLTGYFGRVIVLIGATLFVIFNFNFMKRLYCLPAIVALLFCACSQPGAGLLKPSNLSSSFITIDPLQDNALKTPKGAIIKIAANSFEVPAGTKVSIEIKEAYSMQDILRAGLSTVSNGKLLQSGGMIYFNATANNENVSFLKAVGITIPSASYNDSMKVFSGKIEADSSINWIEPKQLDSSSLFKELAAGEALFKANCAACHKPIDDMTGPALAGCRNREPNKEWAYKWINNVNSMLESDWYARSMLRKWGSRMTQFNLTKEDIKAILDYCDNEALLYKPALLSASYAQDSLAGMQDCGYDTIPVFDRILLEDTTNEIINPVVSPALLPPPPAYSFSINYSGWYNIDCFINNNRDAIQDVVLKVMVNDTSKIDLQPWLCVPSRKLLTQGYSFKSGEFVFGDEQGVISLIKGDEAFVYMIGSNDKQFYYGIKKFVVQNKQEISINLTLSNKEDILESLRKNKIDNISIDKDEPVIEDFIKVDVPAESGAGENTDDSTKHTADSIMKKEMQILKKSCAGDSTKAPVFAAAVKP